MGPVPTSELRVLRQTVARRVALAPDRAGRGRDGRERPRRPPQLLCHVHTAWLAARRTRSCGPQADGSPRRGPHPGPSRGHRGGAAGARPGRARVPSGQIKGEETGGSRNVAQAGCPVSPGGDSTGPGGPSSQRQPGPLCVRGNHQPRVLKKQACGRDLGFHSGTWPSWDGDAAVLCFIGRCTF